MRIYTFKKIVLIMGLVLLLFLISNFQFPISNVNAQRAVQDDVSLGDVDDNVGLDPINIPFFDQPSFLEDSEFYSIFSWISFGGLMFSIGLVIFWIALIVRAAFQALRSEGNDEGIGEAFQRVQSVFIGAGVSIAVPLLISIFGAILGLGPLWDWPAGLRNCPGTGNDYFFQEVLDQRSSGADLAVDLAEEACFASEVL